MQRQMPGSGEQFKVKIFVQRAEQVDLIGVFDKNPLHSDNRRGFLDRGFVSHRRKGIHNFAFDPGAQEMFLLQQIRVNMRHQSAGLAKCCDQPIALEPLNRLPQGRGADAELLGQFRPRKPHTVNMITSTGGVRPLKREYRSRAFASHQ